MAQERSQSRRIIGIFIEGVILRNGFGLRIDYKLVGIATARFAVQRGTPLPENLLQFFLGLRRDLFNGCNPHRAQSSFGDFTDAGNFSHREWRQKSLFASRRNPNETARLAVIGSYFSHQARRSESARTWQTGSASNVAEKFVRGGQRWPVQPFRARQIEIRLVDGHHFNHWRKVREYPRDPVAPLRVLRVVSIKKNRVRTQPSRSSQGHRRLNAKFPRFIARCGNYSTLIGAPAHHNWLTTKLGTLQQLHRNKKRVHVHMQY